MIFKLPPTPAPGRRYLAVILAAGLLLIAGLGLVVIDRTLRASALDEAERVAQNEAAIFAAGLESELDKFSLVPLVLAKDPQVQSLLLGSRIQQAGLNRRLEQIAQQSGAAAIYLMDDKGLTLAASNWNRPDSFVGSNYRFRHYFREAVTSGTANEFALGTVSRRPGLYISRRVNTPSGPVGVVAIKVEFDTIEANWAKATSGVYVTDADGVILVTSKSDWRFNTTRPVSAGQRNMEQDRRQFGKSELPLFTPETGITSAQAPLINSIKPVAPFNWQLHLLSDPSISLAAAKANARLLFLLLLVLAVCTVAAAAVSIRRREARAQQLVNERTALLRDQLQ
ncbi:MAG: hypothetical protein KA199_03640, partial [Sphingorhabdus sp.]|nr:hypothetical protein [Sphingorhabdus sp.]